MEKKKINLFLLWSFVIAWILQVAASWFAWKGQRIAYTLFLAVSMYAPLFGVILAKTPLSGMGWKPQIKGNIRWIGAAWFGPALVATIGAALYFLLFPARIDLTGAYLTHTAGETVLDQLEAQGLTLPIYIMIQVVSAISYAPWINMFFAVGEEAGWRGALYPYLKERFGLTKGRIVGGVIWGVWHWPIMILAGYEYGSVYWGAPVLGIILFCLITMGMGTLLDVLYVKTKCIWVPSLAHGAINAFAGVPLLFNNPDYLNQMTLGPTMVGIIGGLPMLLLAILVLFGRKTLPVNSD